MLPLKQTEESAWRSFFVRRYRTVGPTIRLVLIGKFAAHLLVQQCVHVHLERKTISVICRKEIPGKHEPRVGDRFIGNPRVLKLLSDIQLSTRTTFVRRCGEVFTCLKKSARLTCHCSSCWLSSTFCWMASISWLLACSTSIRVLASSTWVAFLRATAPSRTSHAFLIISSLANESRSCMSERARSRSSLAPANSVSHTLSCKTQKAN